MDGGAGEAGPTVGTLAGCFWGRVWAIDCLLTLRGDASGGLSGVLEADGEPLEVSFTPGPPGELCGVVQAAALPEPFATFRARPTPDGRALQAEVTAAGGSPGPPQTVTFWRLEP